MRDDGPFYDGFDCAPSLRLQAHERVTQLQITDLTRRLERISTDMERLERRLWLAVFGVAGAIITQAFQSIMQLP